MLALLLVLLNGFFVIAEFSMVKVRKTRLEELAQQGKKRAEMALVILASFDTYLGATQLGITLSSLALGWIGEPAIASLIEPPLLAMFPELEWLVLPASVAVGFTIITFLHIVIGELVPKSMAIQKAENLALFCTWPLYFFHKLGYPVIILFNRTARAILSLLGVKPANETDLAHSEEELRMILSASQRGGVLNQMESELIDNVFDFADRLAREIMVPRQDMICLYLEDSFEENLKVVRETNHTRYPLCQGDKDNVVGMIHIRDLMDFDLFRSQDRDLRIVMREILVVPESMSVAKLLQLMRRRRIHQAVVADEYGGTAGLVALEDVLEEIVGEIEDEHDEIAAPEIQRIQEGVYQFDGRVLLDEVTELLAIRLDEHEEDTIGGYLFALIGRRPEINDVVRIGNYRFTVLQANGFRIVRVKAEPLQEDA